MSARELEMIWFGDGRETQSGAVAASEDRRFISEDYRHWRLPGLVEG